MKLMSRAWLSILCFAAALSYAFAGNIDMTGRMIVATVTEDNLLSGSLASRFVAPGTELEIAPVLDSGNAHSSYALLVPGTAETTVTVNGHRLNIMPAQRLNALVFAVGPRYLVTGPSTLQIERSAPGTWAGLTLFSVRPGYEEFHFQQEFGEYETASTSRVPREFPVSPTQTSYDVQWYDCTWIPSVNTPYMNVGSEMTMGATAVNNISFVDLDFDLGGNGSMQVDSVDSGPDTASLSWSNLPDTNTPRIRVSLPSTVSAGSNFVLRVAFHGRPNTNFPKKLFGTNALYATTHDNGHPVVYTASQAYGGRRWWPSKDHPTDKATTTVQHIIVPKETGYTLTAVSNGVLEQTIDHGTTLEYVWRNSYPIATYLLSMAISDYVYTGGTYTSLDGQTTMPVGSYIYPEDVGFEGDGYLGTLQVMNFYADKFGEYPFLNEKYVTAAWKSGMPLNTKPARACRGDLLWGWRTG